MTFTIIFFLLVNIKYIYSNTSIESMLRFFNVFVTFSFANVGVGLVWEPLVSNTAVD